MLIPVTHPTRPISFCFESFSLITAIDAMDRKELQKLS
jgi:hypothetical protein